MRCLTNTNKKTKQSAHIPLEEHGIVQHILYDAATVIREMDSFVMFCFCSKPRFRTHFSATKVGIWTACPEMTRDWKARGGCQVFFFRFGLAVSKHGSWGVCSVFRLTRSAVCLPRA